MQPEPSTQPSKLFVEAAVSQLIPVVEPTMEELQAFLEEKIPQWAIDPVLFAKDCFGFIPTPQQIKIMNDVAEPGSKTAVKSGINTGKTAIAAILAIWFLLFHCPCKAAATSASAAQLQDALMPEIALWLTRANGWVRSQITVQKMRAYVIGGEQEQFLTAKTARADKPDALQGLHSDNIFVIIDEAFAVSDKVIEVAWAALTKKNARLLLMGNPTRTSGFAHRAFNRDASLYKRFTLSTLDSPLVSPTALEQLKKIYDYPDSDAAKARLLGEFPSGSFNQLIPLELVRAAIERGRNLKPDEYRYAPLGLGVDPAWMGDDRSIIWMRQGIFAKPLFRGVKVPNPTLVGKVIEFWDKYRADSVFVDQGMGNGLLDDLRALGRNPIQVNFGDTAMDAQYKYKTTEMAFAVLKWLKEGGAIVCNNKEEEDEVVADLTGPEYYFTEGGGKKLIESKDQMRARGLRSPDYFDGLKLTFAYPMFKADDLGQAYSMVHGNTDRSDSSWDAYKE